MITLADTHIYVIKNNDRLSEDEVFLYCLTLNHMGFKDWRLTNFNDFKLDEHYLLFKQRVDDIMFEQSKQLCYTQYQYQAITPVRDS